MRTFEITRLHSKLGIFKLNGCLAGEERAANFEIYQLSMMGTDGWEVLDISHVKTQTLIAELSPEISVHLQSRGNR